MKAFVLITLLIVSVFAQIYYKGFSIISNKSIKKIIKILDDPGCSFSNLPPKTYIENCCPTLPHYYNPNLFRECHEFCKMWMVKPKEKGSRKCCMINCTLVVSGSMIKYGAFVPSVMINEIKKNVTKNSDIWNKTIENVVMNCFNERKYEMNNLLKIIVKFSCTVKDHPNDKIEDLIPQCESFEISLALNITRCIRREMFFACQDDPMIKSEDCKALVEYGRGW